MAVSQHWFGHKAEKQTWLYICGVDIAAIPPVQPMLLDATHVIETRKRGVPIQSLMTAAEGGSKLVPVLGNIISGIAAYHDIFGKEGLIRKYSNCMSGKD